MHLATKIKTYFSSYLCIISFVLPVKFLSINCQEHISDIPKRVAYAKVWHPHWYSGPLRLVQRYFVFNVHNAGVGTFLVILRCSHFYRKCFSHFFTRKNGMQKIKCYHFVSSNNILCFVTTVSSVRDNFSKCLQLFNLMRSFNYVIKFIYILQLKLDHNCTVYHIRVLEPKVYYP